MLAGCSSMERVVVDASVAVKWFVAERDTDRALRLRDSYLSGGLELVAPSLIYYEAANALRFHPYYGLTETELLKAITALRNMQIAIEPTTETWHKAFEVSKSEGIAVYDAIYIATSMTLDAKLVTSDRVLIERLSENMKGGITLLGESSF